MSTWLAVAMLGGVVGLDATSFPQVMVSRPIVAGTITGALFGRPLEGLLIGMLAEVFSLASMPVGAARYPESGTATVAATAAYLYAVPFGIAPGPLLLALLFVLAWERVAGWTVVLHRRNNGQLMLAGGSPTARELERRHLTALGLDFMRAAVVAASGGVVGGAILGVIARPWPFSLELTGAVLGIAAAVLIGAMVRLFGSSTAVRTGLLAGILAGAAIALVVS